MVADFALSVLDRLDSEGFDSVWSDLDESNRELTRNLIPDYCRDFVIIHEAETILFFESAGYWDYCLLGTPTIELPDDISFEDWKAISKLLPGVILKLSPKPSVTPFHDQFQRAIDRLIKDS